MTEEEVKDTAATLAQVHQAAMDRADEQYEDALSALRQKCPHFYPVAATSYSLHFCRACGAYREKVPA